jgi:DNA mismatch repair protein PMS2
VRFKDFGLESIEVQDNGTGISSDNFELLLKRHHTSKLSSFEDLSLVSTYGFRGEALSSLASICDLMITTRHESDTTGVLLKYDRMGNVTSKTPVDRVCGTTITCLNLFGNYSVRQRELQKNIKREFNKCCGMLQAYALIGDNVRICVTTHAGSNATKKR